MLTRMFNRLSRNQRGVTGLETAIILIAFVVVASVFAYTVLSAGIFSAEKGKEAIHSGLEQARSSMDIQGSVKATSIAATVLNDDGGIWVASANVTDASDTDDRKSGTDSVELVIAAGFTTGLVAYANTASTIDLTSPKHYAVRLWIKSTVTLAAGVLQLVIDDDPNCASPLESIDIPALTANTWIQPVLDIADPSAVTLNSIDCVGITAVSDPGTPTINVDLIQGPAEVSEVSFIVANSLDGEAIDLTTTTDSDSDGLLSDETKLHKLSVIYSDKDQRTVDITWTRTQLGAGDGDALLEPGERMKITVLTHAANPVAVANTTFTLTIARGKGADLSLTRTLPAVLTPEMDLN